MPSIDSVPSVGSVPVALPKWLLQVPVPAVGLVLVWLQMGLGAGSRIAESAGLPFGSKLLLPG